MVLIRNTNNVAFMVCILEGIRYRIVLLNLTLKHVYAVFLSLIKLNHILMSS